MAVDWEAIRLQYELYNEEAVTLANENDVSLEMVEYAIESQGWKRAPVNGLMSTVGDARNLDSCSEDVMESIQERLSVVNILKSATMNPKYIALETAILNKAREIVHALTPGTANVGDQLKKVAEVLEKLKLASVPPGMREDGSGNDNRITVQILNQTQISQEKSPSTEVVVR